MSVVTGIHVDDDLSLLIYLSPYHQYLYPYTTYIWGRAGDVFLISFFTFDSFISPTNIYCKCVRAFLGLSCCACFLRLFCLLITFATLLILSLPPFSLFMTLLPSVLLESCCCVRRWHSVKIPLCDGCYRCCVCIESVKLKRTWTDTNWERILMKHFPGTVFLLFIIHVDSVSCVAIYFGEEEEKFHLQPEIPIR